MTTAQYRTSTTLLKSVSVGGFRCFGDEQTARLAPLTLLVGDNSTGKSSLMALIGVLWEVLFAGRMQPDFNREPFDLGGFQDMVHFRGGRGGRRDSFTAGVALEDKLDKSRSLAATATFGEKDGYPEVRSYAYSDNTCSIKVGNDSKRVTLMWHDLDAPSSIVHEINTSEYSPFLDQYPPGRYLWKIILREMENNSKGRETEREAIRELLGKITSIYREYPPGEIGFAFMAPLRAQPERIYLLGKSMVDPGAYNLPNQLITTKHTDPLLWKLIKEGVETFGRYLGLFSQFDVVTVANGKGMGPFEMRVRGNPRQPRPVGPWRNLVDTGYGVSQILPLVCRLSDPGTRVHLVQQPEIHLHPKAQAALGSFLCEWVAEERGQLIIETHSQYLLNRVRMEVRDSGIDIGPDDVSVAFFESHGLESKIANIGFDGLGNVQGAPPGYDSFFVDEVTRSIGL